MRIGILARGLSTPIGGAFRVVEEALNGLPRLGGEAHEFVSYQPSGVPVSPGVEPVWVNAAHTLLWEWSALPRAIRLAPPDLLFAPKTLLPAGIPRGIKTLSVVLDLLYFSVRGRYLHEYKWRDIAYNRLFYRASCRRATALACISDYTRRDLLQVCPMPKEKVHVVPLGVHLPDPESLAPNRVAEVRASHGLERPYIFYAGSLSPRKNMVRGVRAWARIADQVLHDLVVTAGKSWRDSAVEREVDRCGLRSRFRRLGVVPDADLPSLYAGASTFFFPSLYEGFGLPVLEAMACGCPVVASNATAIPEVAGSAALLVDPYDVDAMAMALLHMLTERALAGEYRAAGLEHAARCSWDRTVRGWLDIMEAITTP